MYSVLENPGQTPRLQDGVEVSAVTQTTQGIQNYPAGGKLNNEDAPYVGSSSSDMLTLMEGMYVFDVVNNNFCTVRQVMSLGVTQK